MIGIHLFCLINSLKLLSYLHWIFMQHFQLRNGPNPVGSCITIAKFKCSFRQMFMSSVMYFHHFIAIDHSSTGSRSASITFISITPPTDAVFTYILSVHVKTVSIRIKKSLISICFEYSKVDISYKIEKIHTLELVWMKFYCRMAVNKNKYVNSFIWTTLFVKINSGQQWICVV